METTDTISLLDGTKYELLPQASLSRLGLKLPQTGAFAAVKNFTDENLAHIVIQTNGDASGEYDHMRLAAVVFLPEDQEHCYFRLERKEGYR